MFYFCAPAQYYYHPIKIIMVQKIFQCCSNKPVFQITYSVSGSEKDYLVCSSCIQKEYFSKYIIRRLSVENKIKNFQNEPSELTDESSGIFESYDEQVSQNEQSNEHGGAVTK